MDKSQALHSFWSSFQLPAFDENTVPNGDNKPSYPYITYDVVIGEFDEFTAMSASLWDYGSSWSTITTKLAEISAKIGKGGCIVPCDGGALWIKMGSPFAQRIGDSNDMIRRIYINIVVEYVTAG